MIKILLDKIALQMGGKLMLKQTGYKRVAAIKGTRIPYLYYALYDDDIEAGDTVLVSGCNTGKIVEVNHTFPAHCITRYFDKEITEEVICKVDMSAYNKRLTLRAEEEKRNKLDDLEKQMYEISDEYNSIVSEYLNLLHKK